jgi:hypothetical protein
MVIINQIVEINSFLVKAVFEIPSPHWLNICRLIFWAFVCLPAIRQVS